MRFIHQVICAQVIKYLAYRLFYFTTIVITFAGSILASRSSKINAKHIYIHTLFPPIFLRHIFLGQATPMRDSRNHTKWKEKI